MKKGNVLLSVIILLSVLLTMSLSLASAILSMNIKIQKAYTRLSALAYAEAGVNRALWEINSNSNPTFATSSWILDNTLSGGEFRVHAEPCAANPSDPLCKEITSIGYIPNYAKPYTQRTVKIKLLGVQSVTNMNFNFAAQSNSNEVWLSNGSAVKGSVYSNGPIFMDGGSNITGNATSSGTTPTTSMLSKGVGSKPKVLGTATAFTVDSDIITGTKVTGAFPTPQAMPIPDAQLESTIDSWEAAANAGSHPAVTGGILTLSGTNNQLGPAYVNGDLVINGDLQINGTIWVNGNITVATGSHVFLNPSFGNNGAVMIADYKTNRALKGKITVNSGAYISGTQKLNPKTPSYTMMFSTHTSTAADWKTNFAIGLDGPNIQGGVYYAPFGSFHKKNNGQIRAVACNGLVLDNNVVLDYDGNWGNSGISNGPGGKWTIVEWQILY